MSEQEFQEPIESNINNDIYSEQMPEQELQEPNESSDDSDISEQMSEQELQEPNESSDDSDISEQISEQEVQEPNESNNNGDISKQTLTNKPLLLRTQLAWIPDGYTHKPFTQEDIEQEFPEKEDVFVRLFPMYMGEGFNVEFLQTALSKIGMQMYQKKISWFGIPVLELVQAEARAIDLLKGVASTQFEKNLDKKQLAEVTTELGLADLSVSDEPMDSRAKLDVLAAMAAAMYVDGGGMHMVGGWLLKNIYKI
eukprot:TRINITY_DN953_c0_g1_i10.p2 TRINITY_DN953_c0_g1~~TRINITY_DN953_c0_g1_i10.p2  ORF type:complete len:298 (-),score=58.27 TRINITY_DN953_c0_g1_i10:175-936(-)